MNKIKENNMGRIAFLSNFNLDPIAQDIQKICLEKGIDCKVFISPYNQYAQQILNNQSELYAFSPEIIFIALDVENLLGELFFRPYKIDKSEREKVMMDHLNETISLINTLKINTSAKIVINSLAKSIYSSKGIIENKEELGINSIIERFNKGLENLSLKDNQIFVFDFNRFYMKYGRDNVVDERFVYLADMKVSIPALKLLAKEYFAYIIPLKNLTKKCIVLDLDNTLWGGVVGEAGINGINLGPDKKGLPFLNFQKRIIELFERGVILAINSKNNSEDVLEVLRNHKYMVLKEDNFASIKANWENKVTNMVEIAKEINIGLDSMIFIDDDPSNRALIKEFLPEVMVLDMPSDPSLYCKSLEELNVFSLFSLTSEDFERGKTYIDERKRNLFKDATKSLEDFIKELNIECSICQNPVEEIPRIAQLTQKTNQFNLTTKRYSEEEITEMINSKNYVIKTLQVKDRFGDYGITGLAIIKRVNSSIWEMDSFLLSCRILGKGIEFSFIKEIIGDAKKQGIGGLKAKFIPTKKNLPAKDFLKLAGFDLITESDNGAEYLLDINRL